jgi:peptidoglycan/LPS O-acetylase OafA/YrhL
MFIAAVVVIYNRLNVFTVLGPFFATLSIILIAIAAASCFYFIFERPLLHWVSTRAATKFNTQLARS